MSELATTIREALATLAGGDRALRRFGAVHHRYELAPPLAEATLDALGVELVPDLLEFVTAIGSGGAGPYYGWLPLERAARRVDDVPPGVPWQHAIPIAHLGCGYAAVLPLDGAVRGEIWLDARQLGIARPIAATFIAFYLDWIEHLLRGAVPPSHVPGDACPLPHALSGYLATYEQQHGVAAGTLAGDDLRAALAALAPGAIEIGAAAPLFELGDRADPCIACARILENLGLSASVVAPGVPPLPNRSK